MLSEKFINGIVVNTSLPSLHGWLLEIAGTVPLRELFHPDVYPLENDLKINLFWNGREGVFKIDILFPFRILKYLFLSVIFWKVF